MKKTIALMGCAVALLSACQSVTEVSEASPYITEVPEGVLTVAAAGQDLTALQIDPIDGCYVYRHIGPVETTFLPLRSKDGRPICSRAL